MNQELHNDISRMILMCNYSQSKTLSENLLSESQQILQSRLGLLTEQNPLLRVVPWWTDELTKKAVQSWQKDPHGFLATVSVVATVLTFVGGPLGLVAAGIGLAADLYDAKLYFDEGDNYMGTIMMCLAVIPGGELAKIIGKKIPKSVYKPLLRRAKDGIKNLAPNEVKMLKDFSESLFRHKEAIAKAFTHNTVRKLVRNIPYTLAKIPAGIALHIGLFFLKTAMFLGKITVTIGGTVILADNLYIYLYGNTWQRMKRIKEMKEIYELIKRYFNGDIKKADKKLKEKVNETLVDPAFIKEFEKQVNTESDMEEVLKKFKEMKNDTSLNSPPEAPPLIDTIPNF